MSTGIKAMSALSGPLCRSVGAQTPLFCPLLQSQLPSGVKRSITLDEHGNNQQFILKSYLNVDDMPVTLKYVCGLGKKSGQHTEKSPRPPGRFPEPSCYETTVLSTELYRCPYETHQ